MKLKRANVLVGGIFLDHMLNGLVASTIGTLGLNDCISYLLLLSQYSLGIPLTYPLSMPYADQMVNCFIFYWTSVLMLLCKILCTT